MPTGSGGRGWLGTGTEIETGRTGTVWFDSVRSEDESRGVSGSPWTGDVSEVELLLTGSSRLLRIFLLHFPFFFLPELVLVDLRLLLMGVR
jgi:hypothetical protein